MSRRPISALDLNGFSARYGVMITRKKFVIVAAVILATAAVVALAQSAAKPVMHSSVFNFSSLKAETKPSGERRQVFDSPTATLDRLECHITTLNPGEVPHAAHQHPEEELVFLKEDDIVAVIEG